MAPDLIRRWAYAGLILIQAPLSAEVTGYLKIAAIRVEFLEDESPGTTGNGLFLNLPLETICGNYTLDSPPHDINYFNSQLKALDNYYRRVSFGKFGLNLDQSTVFPVEGAAGYKLEHSMNFYHPLGQEDQVERLSTELFRDAVGAALRQDNLDLGEYDLVIIFHAGVGQDFTVPFLDPTPEDIVSAYIDENMLDEYLGGPLQAGSVQLKRGIIVPESQNHLLYSESVFSDLESPCDFQYGLTGTLALMVGYSVGLPPLWETVTGLTGIGVFGLMDQGSNNGRGVVPAPPEAWTRIYAGWEQPLNITVNSEITLSAVEKNALIKIPINDNEYFLLENRSNWYRSGVSIDSARFSIWQETGIYPPFIEVLMDSIQLVIENGVILSVQNYNLGLPASGLLIWHIDEQKIRDGLGSYTVNSQRDHRGIDLEEADGAQDIGHISTLLFDPSSGYFGDMWFTGNREYERANPDLKGKSPVFSTFTYPDTRANNGAESRITISNISPPALDMTFNIDFDLPFFGIPGDNQEFLMQWDLNGDGELEFFGGGDSLWWSKQDLEKTESFYALNWEKYEVVLVQNSLERSFVLIGRNQDQIDVLWFEFDLKQGNFKLKWSKSFSTPCGIGFIEADYVREVVNMAHRGIIYSITEDSVNTTQLEAEEICGPAVIEFSSIINDTFTVTLGLEEISTSSGDFYKGKFIDLALIDLEFDGEVDIIALGSSGHVFAFDKFLILKTGYPILISAVPPVLAGDLLDDFHPELIVKNLAGDIIILNHKGQLLHRFTDKILNNLEMLGIHNQKQSLITLDHITLFKNSEADGGNLWQTKYGHPDHSREIALQIAPADPDETVLINKELTYAYPNPSYGPQVKLRIRVESARKIKVNIFDSAGYHVKSFDLENPRPASINELIWDISGQQSGIYFAHLKAVNGSIVEEKIIRIGV
ncbi:MAG: T9SS type A sorting domain-containing protein, partial [Candidatus Neomarinimicrobiota bacterium]